MARAAGKITTEAIQAWRALGRGPDEGWVDWAVQLLVEGSDTPTLRIVAGLMPPFDYFEVTKYVDQALLELGASVGNKDDAVNTWAIEMVEDLLRDAQVMERALKELADLCVESDYSSSLMPFYLLHNAKQDLSAKEVQWYWKGADRSNIDSTIRREAQRWLSEHKRAV